MRRPTRFATRRLPAEDHVIAPDGSEVRILVGLAGGGLAHFRLQPNAVSVAVRHRTVEEMWYVVSGRGQMWRSGEEGGDEVEVDGGGGGGGSGGGGGGRGEDGDGEIVELEPGVALTIPVNTRFQFRAFGPESLDVIGVTLPPWPGEGEAIRTEGPWRATVAAGPGLAEPDD